jgi:Glutaminase
MPSIVSTIRSVGVEGRTVPEALTAAGPEGISIEFSNGARARLAPQSRAFAEIIEELRTLGAPVYVETDREGVIRAVWIPAVFLVQSLEMTREGDVSVQLIISQARHVLRADQPHFNSFRDILSAAKVSATPVMVTVNGAGEIIDVREAPSDHPFALVQPDQIQPAGAAKITAPIPRISFDEAKRLFALCAGTSCNPTTVPPPCIPFLYPRDGCWGRAHEMYRLMNAKGEPPWKGWIYGNLVVSTRNDPYCVVSWGWHVAPYLYVGHGDTYHAYVIDPSLFSEPVPWESWVAAQGDPRAVTAASEGTVFYRYPDGRTEEDSDYTKTNKVLALYRLQLKTMALGPSGPPPYAWCPVGIEREVAASATT